MAREDAVGTFTYRLFGAAALDAGTFEGLEADRSAMSQSVAVVVLSSLAAGFGAGGTNLPAFLIISLIALGSWIVWAFLMVQIGGRLLPGPNTHVDVGELLRTTGFAAAPGFLQVFAVLPNMLVPVFTITWIWMLAAMVVAVRQALDYSSTKRALAVCGLAWAISLSVAIILGLLFGPAAS
jgi:hypothetical protein